MIDNQRNPPLAHQRGTIRGVNGRRGHGGGIVLAVDSHIALEGIVHRLDAMLLTKLPDRLSQSLDRCGGDAPVPGRTHSFNGELVDVQQ